MDSTRQTILVVGITIAVLVYFVYKFFQWRKKRRDSHFPEPKKRTDAPVAKQRPAKPQPAMRPVSDTSQEVKKPAPPKSATPKPEPIQTGSIFDDDLEPVQPSTIKDRKTPIESITSVSSVNLAQKIQQEQRQKLWEKEQKQKPASRIAFEEIEEEFPYAEADDYRYGPTLTPTMAAFIPTSEESKARTTRTLRNAGHYERHAWHNFAANRYLGVMGAIVFFLAMLIIVPESLEPWMMIGLIVGPILGWALPGLAIQSQAERRIREIEVGMPDMLDLLNMCVSQGMTMQRALGRVSHEIAPVYPALGKELEIVSEQAHIGSLSQALYNFSSRVDVPEVHSFTSLVTQTERMGTSVSESLAEHSDNMRQSLQQRADQKANTAAFKLLFPTVFCLMPAVYMFLMGPAVLEMDKFVRGGGRDALNNVEIPERFREQ